MSLVRQMEAPVGVYDSDRDELYLINVERLAGQNAEAWVGSLFRWVDPQDLSRFERLIGVSSNEKREETLHLKAPDGHLRAHRVIATRIGDAGLVCLTFDSLNTDHVDRTDSAEAMAAAVGDELTGSLNHVTGHLDLAWGNLDRALDLAADGASPSIYLQMVEEALNRVEHSLRGTRRIRESAALLSGFGARACAGLERLDVQDVLKDSVRLSRTMAHQKCSIHLDTEDKLWVHARPTSLRHAFTNLILRAANSSQRRPRWAHEIRIVARREGARVSVTVDDTGPAIPSEAQGEIFELGLEDADISVQGMAIAERLFSGADGEIRLIESSNEGTKFRVELPYEPGALDPTGRREMLIIDDEEALLDVLARRLEKDWNVETIDDAAAAVSRIRDSPDRFDIILCDLTMRSMSGFRIYHAVVTTNPELGARFIFMTGGALTPETEVFSEAFSDRVLMKPFTREHLLETIDLMQEQAEERARLMPR